ncbi:DUF2933 domain-containing protein [Phreatobacter oligotrophus]|jgi:hypothetical protein|uniref:DUF2933 family protein n=1 Tax=Phreatobacter oligotrophus TaxID=1122261 RepID=A0A2T4YWJ5_9HYPH|nr:DUF2933 domain-containing protein [Phreatobacter oligotrophus]PTM48837.1 Protein of unknown function (DUF2933) [Phreatobacter oligotrophus]
MRAFNPNRKLALAIISLGVVVGFYVLREHWGHVLGAVPYLVLLACPLLHFFHGHGSHGPGSIEEHRH